MKCGATQREITAPWPLPPCKSGHRARLMEDQRRPAAGGGHFIECQCNRTNKHAGPHLALQEWTRLYALAPASPASTSNVIQLGLGLGDRRVR